MVRSLAIGVVVLFVLSLVFGRTDIAIMSGGVLFLLGAYKASAFVGSAFIKLLVLGGAAFLIAQTLGVLR